jgi:hypothetical protein
MLKIPLSQGKFAIVGPRDYIYLMQWKWCYMKGYAVRHDNGRPGRPLIYMHRVILERMGFKDFEQCDHINRDGIDNRRTNLRSATHQQNGRNRGKQCNNTSGYIGVHRHKATKKWCAQMNINGKRKHLGYFDDIEEAKQARDKAVKEFYGEFAPLNKE